MTDAHRFDPISLLACPACYGPLEAAEGDGLRCTRCDRPARRRGGHLDMMHGVAAPPSGLGPRLMHFPPVARIYEKHWRPLFVTATGRGRISFEQELVLVERYLDPAQGGAVLDLSCGPGLFGRRLHKSNHFQHVYALDRSEVMLQQCLGHCQAEGIDDLSLLWGDATRLPFAEDSLAGIHAGFALHLWSDLEGGLAEVVRTLAPGGVFVASTLLEPAAGRTGRFAAAAAREMAGVTLFTEKRLRALLHAADLRRFHAVVRGAFIVLRGEKGVAPMVPVSQASA